VLRGRCLAYGEGITFFPVVEVLKQAADIADFEDPSETDRKICALVEDEDHGSLICARIGQLLGLAEGEAVAQETLWAIRRFLEALARERPVVVVFDDIHWGESTFLDLIEYVAEWTREAPMVLVCPARPELLDVRPGWAGGKPNASTVALEPLPEDESERLLTNLLGEAGVGDKVRSSILEAAEGTPLFVEQVVSMLIDDGLLARQDGRWVARGALSEIRIPPTIAALLAARLDRLSAEERSVIQRASVVGKIFYRGAVGALSPEKDRSAAPGHLLSLVRKELLRPDRTTLPGEDAFRFRHQLIRDAAYESTPKEARAELHERFANWLADVAGERVEEQEEILGYHLEQACRYREQLGQAAKPELRRRARAHLSAAGRRAAARGDMGASASLLRRAVALYDTGDGERRALLTELGLVLLETGPYDEAGSVLREAIEEAEVAGDRLTAAHARIGEVMLRVSSDPEGTGKEATRVADELIPVFEAAGDDLGLARAYRLRSTAPWVATRYSEMAADAERAMEHARRAGHQAEEGFGHEMFAVAYTFGPVPVEEALPRLAAAREELSGMRRELEAESAILLAMAGKLDEARRVLERSRAVFEDLGRPVWAASIQLARGLVELIAGDTLEAERALRLGRDEFLRVGEKGVLSTLSSFLARSLCLQGRFEEAEPFIDESRSLASSEDVASQTGWRTAKAMVLLDRGELDEAERLAREAVALAESGDAPDEHGDALGMLAEVVILGGRPEEAGPLLREAIDRYERKGNVMSAARVRARLAAIAESYGEREDER
jgi:tetratricopeptide (TPR) repeat protein